MKWEDYPTVVKDMLQAIDNDLYMWVVIWGEARTGKSMLALLILHWIYQDWRKVLNAVTFNLSQTVYKIKHNLPELRPTQNMLHNRIPALLWDDFGAHSNKAKTQHDRAWDTFKGGFDVLGTRIGVLMATMVEPSEPTQQLQNKYTHEIWVYERGRAKYDRYHSQQDYRGFRTRGRKTWVDDFEFDPIPDEVFKEYDQMRQALADEVLLAIEDVVVETQLAYLIRRLDKYDLTVMQMIKDMGPVYHQKVYEQLGKDLGKKVLTRLKSRGIITTLTDRDSGYYRYDMNDIGFEILKELASQTTSIDSKDSKISSNIY
jgi:hypothetical protein